MNWLKYLLEANLYLVVFYLCYGLFFKKETYYTLNRIYLLSSCVVSFFLPMVQVGILRPAETIIQRTVVKMPDTDTQIVPQHVRIVHPVAMHLTLQGCILYIYILGAFIMLILLAVKLYQLSKLTHSPSSIIEDRYKIICIDGSNTAFSFFNYLFIGTEVHGRATIIRHELVHIRQKHSVDIILMEIIKIINWFNPLVYLLQNSFKTVHEYIADEKTALFETDALAYSTFLFNNAYGISGSSLTRSFFNYNLLKKRIIMLHQKRSGSLARLKYLVALPVCAGLLCASTLGFSKNYGWLDLMPRYKSLHSAKSPVVVTADTLKDRLSTTKKGYKYLETGYLIKNKADFRVIITEKNGDQKAYFKSSSTPADLKLLKEKYGYTFPSMEIFPKLPPPPPGPPAPPAKPHGPRGVKNFSPPVVAPDTVISQKMGKASARPQSAFDSLYKFLAKRVRYPTRAYVNHIAGRVIINFNIIDGKIVDVTMVRGLFPEIDAEAMRVINDFKAPLNVKSAYYTISVSFVIIDAKGNFVGGPPKTNDNNTATVPNTKMARQDASFMLNEVVVASYL